MIDVCILPTYFHFKPFLIIILNSVHEFLNKIQEQFSHCKLTGCGRIRVLTIVYIKVTILEPYVLFLFSLKLQIHLSYIAFTLYVFYTLNNNEIYYMIPHIEKEC
jgi:hypothetical protein